MDKSNQVPNNLRDIYIGLPVHFIVLFFGLAFEQADYMTHNRAGESVRIELHPDPVAMAVLF